jgi:DnaJ-class molecular chaperone
MQNYYEILNIDINATKEEVYDAYKNKISQFNSLPFHTQKMIGEIKKLKEALYVLGNTEKRKIYNNKLKLNINLNNISDEFDNTKICNRLFSIVQ